jgi:hypothetical protein
MFIAPPPPSFFRSVRSDMSHRRTLRSYGAPLFFGLFAINISHLRSEDLYSHLNAFIGSTFVARNAGM